MASRSERVSEVGEQPAMAKRSGQNRRGFQSQCARGNATGTEVRAVGRYSGTTRSERREAAHAVRNAS